MAGRGNGKTRSGAEWVRKRVKAGLARRIALVADDAKDARDIMIEGESGLLAVCEANWRPRYIPSQAKLIWEQTGAIAILYSAQDPESLRGPQHDTAWCDELGKWKRQRKAWDMLMFGMRLGQPRTYVTTTPTPSDVILELNDRWQAGDDSVVFTTGHTHENFENLAPEFQRLIRGYEGTRLGRQELYAELLRDVEGALWTIEMLELGRVTRLPAEGLSKLVVAVDPATTNNEGSNETGIVVGALDAVTRQHGYLLDDCSGRYSPGEWADKVLRAHDKWHGLFPNVPIHVVAEGNQGGDLVANNIVSHAKLQNRKPPRVVIVNARVGKWTRAEPVAAQAEKGYVHHVGYFPKLEEQLTRWVPGGDMASPDRLDAFVWCMTELLVKPAYTNKLQTR